MLVKFFNWKQIHYYSDHHFHHKLCNFGEYTARSVCFDIIQSFEIYGCSINLYCLFKYCVYRTEFHTKSECMLWKCHTFLVIKYSENGCSKIAIGNLRTLKRDFSKMKSNSCRYVVGVFIMNLRSVCGTLMLLSIISFKVVIKIIIKALMR